MKTIQTPYIRFFKHGATEISFNTGLNRTFVRCEAGFNRYVLVAVFRSAIFTINSL